MKKIFLILILFLFTGCSSYIELNDLAIINAIGLEKANNTYIMPLVLKKQIILIKCMLQLLWKPIKKQQLLKQLYMK